MMVSNPQGDPGYMDVLKQFRSIFNTVKQHFQHSETTYRISGARLWALTVVIQQPGVRVSDLARTLAVHQSTASNLIEWLAEQKLLEKRRPEQDQRVVRLFPLPAGIELSQKVPLPGKGILPDALAKLSSGRLNDLHRILGELLIVLNVKETGHDIPLSEIWHDGLEDRRQGRIDRRQGEDRRKGTRDRRQ